MFGERRTKSARNLAKGDQVLRNNGEVAGTVDHVDTQVEGEGVDQVVRNTVHYTDGREFPLNHDRFATDEVRIK